MSLLNWRRARRYLSSAAHERNLRSQVAMTPQTLAQLRKAGAKPTFPLPLEFFFYTNAQTKAVALQAALLGRGYSAQAKVSAYNRSEYVVTGWTTRMPIDDDTVVRWAEEMCILGFAHDCEFDGWGTHPTEPNAPMGIS